MLFTDVAIAVLQDKVLYPSTGAVMTTPTELTSLWQ